MSSQHAPAAPRRGPAPTKHMDILWAAADLFGRQGVAQTTTRQIAAAAGTTERTLFKHFGSKDALVQAVIGQAVVAQLAPVSLEALRKAIESEDGDIASWHVALLEQRSASAARAPELARLLLVELLRDEQLRAQFAQQWKAAAWQPLVELFRRLQRGAGRSPRPRRRSAGPHVPEPEHRPPGGAARAGAAGGLERRQGLRGDRPRVRRRRGARLTAAAGARGRLAPVAARLPAPRS